MFRPSVPASVPCPLKKRMISSICGEKKSSSTNMSTVPKTLKSRWISAARLAFFVPPTEESTAEVHAPMLQPRMTNMQMSSSISPCDAMTTRMLTVTEELCTTDVITRPSRTPSTGLVKRESRSMTAGMPRSCVIAADIVLMPRNSTPKPSTASPVLRRTGSLT